MFRLFYKEFWFVIFSPADYMILDTKMMEVAENHGEELKEDIEMMGRL